MKNAIRKKHMHCWKMVYMVGLCAMFLVGQWGCIPHGTSHRQNWAAQLGKVGVVPAQYTPAVEFKLPAKGWLSGAGRGASRGFTTLIVLPAEFALAGAAEGFESGGTPFHAVIGVFLGAALGVVTGAGYLIGGPFYGAVTAESATTVEDAEARLKAALTTMRVQETMRDHVVQTDSPLSGMELIAVQGQGPETPSDLLTYLPLKDADFFTLLELRVSRVWLSRKSSEFPSFHKPDLQINPSLSLGMAVRGRLIRTADKVVLYDNTWIYTGESRLFAEWAANDAKLFVEEFEHAYEELASEVVTAIF